MGNARSTKILFQPPNTKHQPPTVRDSTEDLTFLHSLDVGRLKNTDFGSLFDGKHDVLSCFVEILKQQQTTAATTTIPGINSSNNSNNSSPYNSNSNNNNNGKTNNSHGNL